ncbi:MAG: cupredoxin domain-containing protein [Gallionellaceae bacterium]|jgi:plastocyanin|nr:cupredoxin domain-containing protein [Gallionellaceae bacterium]
MKQTLGCLFAVFALFACQSAGADTVKVGMKNGMFAPAAVTINVGDRVVWFNDDEDTHHRVDFDDPSFKSSGDLRPDKEYAIVFDKPGEFTYYCHYHKDYGMKGQVVVVDKAK